MERIIWCLKQLLPLTYRSRCRVEVEPGVWQERFIVWRMWFGRCFDIDDVPVQPGVFWGGRA